jgi:hypothetical protein
MCTIVDHLRVQSISWRTIAATDRDLQCQLLVQNQHPLPDVALEVPLHEDCGPLSLGKYATRNACVMISRYGKQPLYHRSTLGLEAHVDHALDLCQSEKQWCVAQCHTRPVCPTQSPDDGMIAAAPSPRNRNVTRAGPK